MNILAARPVANDDERSREESERWRRRVDGEEGTGQAEDGRWARSGGRSVHLRRVSSPARACTREAKRRHESKATREIPSFPPSTLTVCSSSRDGGFAPPSGTAQRLLWLMTHSPCSGPFHLQTGDCGTNSPRGPTNDAMDATISDRGRGGYGQGRKEGR